MQNRLSLLLVILITCFIIWELFNAPKKIDWSSSYSKEDVIPLGNRALYEALPNLFEQEIIPINKRLSEHLNAVKDSTSEYPPSCYIIINDAFYPSNNDVTVLTDYISKGNIVFLAVNHLKYDLEKKWTILTEYNYKGYDKETEYYSLRCHFTNSALKMDSDYLFKSKNSFSHISSYDPLKSELLGQHADSDDGYGHINFIRFKIGKGWLYFHSQPSIFSNYNVLHPQNKTYISKAFSHIPADYRIYWDEFYKVGNPLSYYDPEDHNHNTPHKSKTESLFSQLLKSQTLTWALYLSLAGILLFFLFEAKRRQRAIPIIPPIRNATVDFTQAIGMLYLNQGHHKDIIRKKMNYFEETVRSRYLLSTHQIDEHFFKSLAGKSGVSEDIIKKIYHFYHTFEASSIKDEDLMYFNRLMERFEGV